MVLDRGNGAFASPVKFLRQGRVFVFVGHAGDVGILRGFYDKPSLFDTEQLRKFLKKQVEDHGFTQKRPIIATAVDANSGREGLTFR